MKLLLLLLGYYSNRTPFYLYQIPDSTILLFKLSDITTLFNVSDLARHPSLNQVPRGECYTINNFAGHQNIEEFKGQQDYFLSTQVLSRTAVALNRYRLAELCKLKPNDYITGLADSILKNVATFERAKDGKGFHLTDLPLSPAVSPVPSPKQHASFNITTTTASTAATTTTATTAASNNTITHRQGAVLSPRVQPVKFEPLSPPPLRLSQPKDDERFPNPMALGKVLWAKTTDGQSPATRPSADDDSSSINKRQRTERKVLPKPTHTVSSQQAQPIMMNTFTSGPGQTLLAKRQGKNSRHLTIFAPSYADPLSVAIRSAPLNSNFPQGQQQKTQKHGTSGNTTQHQHQHHQQQHISTTLPSTSLHQSIQTSTRQPPKTANLLRPRHTLAPLLSPRAAPVTSSHRHPEPKTTGGAIGKQEFAIPPIVPSQQQPPHTAHPHHSSGNGPHHQHGFTSSSLGRPTSLSSSSHQGYSKSTRLDQSSATNSNNNTTASTAAPSTTTLPVPGSSSTAPMPPQTPTTYSFAALQRQQFLQPFDHLFDTIETTRALKTTLDDQIRRSSTLLQTLQASSTTVEGLVRGHVKEMQNDMASKVDQVLDSMIKRIGQLESKLDLTDGSSSSSSTTTTSRTTTIDHHQRSVTPTAAAPPLKSPTAIVKSQNDVGPDGYQSMLNTLRERLDRLENQLDK
ncbi:hypothetical protein BCR42DRAFT_351648 [Absidia repens]|uniref:Uncharacterized protein n=1 Tax=Absidia repens TaxID=90262 RepID=A0A1X2IIZ2_9FUNG|nr:hypothetical protein BCR42DRAFT_351648 [Absidia repens]